MTPLDKVRLMLSKAEARELAYKIERGAYPFVAGKQTLPISTAEGDLSHDVRVLRGVVKELGG